MSSDVKARMFDPFFSTKSAGRGLGLPMIHGIVQSLHGAIRVESEAGKGTCIRILLPSAGDVAPTRDAGTARAEGASTFPHITVLLVEDEAPLRSATKRMLDKSGFIVLEAADGSDAVELLKAKAAKIDVVLLDMTLPGQPSDEVLRHIGLAYPQAKVVLTSAYSEEMARASLSGPQVRDYVRKPFQLDTLLAALRRAVSS